MADYWIGILGGLIGSILTVVITKLLDIFQSSKQHKYNLEKLFFEKKLSAAEAAMTQYSILSTALINIATLFERLPNIQSKVETYIQQHLLKEASIKLEIANNAYFVIVNSISLYFDFNSKFNQNNVISDFYNLLAAIGPISEKAEIAYDNFIESIGSDLEESSYEKYKLIEQELDSAMKMISGQYSYFNKELKSVMEQIRKEMKKFEY